MRAMIRRGVALLALILTLAVAWPRAHGGGEPVNLPPDWLKVAPGPGAEIVQFVQRLPHDPHSLGVGPAGLRTKDYALPFHTTHFTPRTTHCRSGSSSRGVTTVGCSASPTATRSGIIPSSARC